MTFLLAGGGTGGHVFPLVAVGDALKRLSGDIRVVYVGTSKGLEAKVLPARGDELRLLDILPLRGGGARGFLRGSARAVGVLPEAKRLVDELAPSAVLSIGGYAAGPVALAARLLGIPVALLEPNSVMGLSNLLMAPLVDRAYIAFPETKKWLRSKAISQKGVPLRAAFTPSPYVARPGPVRVLVLGGSLGAVALNDVVPRAIAASGIADLEVLHQVGKDPSREASVRALYDELGVGPRAKVTAFIDDMASELGRADLVVGRSGASAVAELCAVGRASILIPFPYATDDHQMKNARSLEKTGAAVALAQSEADVARVAKELAALATDPARRTAMADAARKLGKPDAARSIAEDFLALAEAYEARRRH